MITINLSLTQANKIQSLLNTVPDKNKTVKSIHRKLWIELNKIDRSM